MQVLTFSSVNDRAVASGQNTLDYVQYASPGSGYAFPTIQEGEVTLNRTLMRDIGVRYSHRQSYGLELLSSCYYYGRPIIQGQAPNQIDNKEIFEQKVFASRRLFIAGNNDHSSTSVKNIGGLLAGINDKITTNSHPETTFYNLMDAKPTGFTNFKNFTEWLKTSLNFQDNLFVTKDFKGMLSFDKDKARLSNGTAIGEAKFFWDSEWNINNISGNYNVDMSSNFKYKDSDTNLIIGSPTVDYSKISQKYMSAILNFNSVVFSPLIQMPYDSTQWLPFALSDIPLIGKLLTDFSPHVLVEETMKLNEFNNTFQTEKQCLAYIASLKQSKCIRCSSFNLNTSNLRKMRCLKCHQTFSILTGTIFSKSQTPLISWFYLIFRWINTKHGIPSTDVAKELGVTLKTAWRMGHKIRSAIAKQEPQFIVEGIVQMDEMYLSHMGFKKQGRSLLNKTLIVGIYEKTTNNLIVKVLKNANSKNLLQFAINHISSKCDVHTDSWKGYRDLKSVFTKHETVNHQDGYVSKTGVNTNQIESVWKHIRRTFKTHIKVAKHHIHLYAKEAAYKFNNIPSFETVMLCLI